MTANDDFIKDQTMSQATFGVTTRAKSSMASTISRRVPKIKVCHKTVEFTVLTALMN